MEPFEAEVKLDAPGGPRAIRPPGHTEGHVSPRFEDLGFVIGGDALEPGHGEPYHGGGSRLRTSSLAL